MPFTELAQKNDSHNMHDCGFIQSKGTKKKVMEKEWEKKSGKKYYFKHKAYQNIKANVK